MMDDKADFPPMRAAREDDVIAERRLWGSPKQLLTSAAIIVATWVAVFVARDVLNLPWLALVIAAAVVSVAAVAFDILRWNRRRHA
ncbi:MAG: hypothetical protein ABI400_11335 [Lacisediminihabitans sp.]